MGVVVQIDCMEEFCNLKDGKCTKCGYGMKSRKKKKKTKDPKESQGGWVDGFPS